MATDPTLAALQSQITNDPRVRAILAAPDKRGHGTTPGSREAQLYELGKQLLPEGYYLASDGSITKKAPWWVKYVGPAAIATAGYGLSALGGAAPAIASGAPAATGGMTATTAAGAPAALSAQILGAGAPTAATTTAAAAAPTIWQRLAPIVISGGLQAAGSYMASRAASKAADQESAAADKALALQKEIFDRSQANQKPFIDAGTGAVNRLNYLMGGGSLGSLGGAQPPQQAPAAQPPQMVNMKAPDGSVKPVPFNEVPHYQQLGAVRVF